MTQSLVQEVTNVIPEIIVEKHTVDTPSKSKQPILESTQQEGEFLRAKTDKPRRRQIKQVSYANCREVIYATICFFEYDHY